MPNIILQNLFSQNSPTAWTGAIVTGGVVTLLLGFCTRMLARWLRQSDRKSTSRWHHMVTDIILSTRVMTHAAVGLWVAMKWLHIAPTWERRLVGGVIAIVLIQMGTWAHRGLGYIIDGLLSDGAANAQSEAKRASRGVLRFFSSLLTWSAVLLLVMENLGINVSALVAGLGVTGVAVALATQSLVSDLFASVSIILDKPFLVGDFIVLENGFQGSVERIGIRTTRLRSLSGEELVIANSDLGKSRVRNFRSLRERRIVFGFSVRYETPLAQLERITGWVREAVEEAGSTRFDRAEMLTFGDAGLGFEAVYYVLDDSYNVYTAIQQKINFRLMRLFEKQDIQFAYRTTLVLKAQDLTESSREMAA